jgi:hypothetical protein
MQKFYKNYEVVHRHTVHIRTVLESNQLENDKTRPDYVNTERTSHIPLPKKRFYV